MNRSAISFIFVTMLIVCAGCGCKETPSSPPIVEEKKNPDATMMTEAFKVLDRGDSTPQKEWRDADDPKVSITNALKISDQDAINDIVTLLMEFRDRQYGAKLSPEHHQNLIKAIKKVRSGAELTGSDVTRLIADGAERNAEEKRLKEEEETKGIKPLKPIEALETAVQRLKQTDSSLSNYEAKHRIITAIHTTWPRSSEYFFPYEKLITPIADIPIPPPVDPKYEHLLHLKSGYENDKIYQELEKMPPEEIPEGALLPILYLTTIPDQYLTHDGYPTATDLAEKIGSRLYSSLLEILSHPETYCHLDETPKYLIRLTTNWPVEQKQVFLRAALNSGWNELLECYKGQHAWADPIVEEFKDSPYGKPRWFR